MSKIYLVIYEEYDIWRVLRAYSIKSLAEDYIERVMEKAIPSYRELLCIDEYEVDQIDDASGETT